MKLRESVQLFAEAMEQRLRENEHKDGWEDIDREWLLRMAESNIETYKNTERLPKQLEDAANYLMMIWDVQTRSLASQVGDPYR